MGLDEFASIRQWTSGRQPQEWQRSRGVVIGIGDDAAVVGGPEAGGSEGGEWQWLLAVDTMVETVHFNEATMTEEDVGYKALAANVSDIAAMGGVPRHALVSVSVPPSYGPERVRRLYDGLYACADKYGVAVVGGDTTSSPQHLVVAVTVVGAVEAGRAVPRSGARPGDAVFLTGPVGMSAAGLHYLLAERSKRRRSGDAATEPIPLSAAEAEGIAALVREHRRPQPSVLAGRLLAKRGTCHALNDVSDGVASEAWELAEASGIAIVLNQARLPRSGTMAAYAHRAGIDPLEWILYGGEDYVLLGTIAQTDADSAKSELAEHGIPFYMIGVVEEGEPGVWLTGDGTGKRMAIAKRGYNHFAENQR
ncbi:thiamine-phosphate kinase [Paenibacillus tarimensis]